jgi:hypothetical protein
MTAATVLSPVVAKLMRAVWRGKSGVSSQIGPILDNSLPEDHLSWESPLTLEFKVLPTLEIMARASESRGK